MSHSYHEQAFESQTYALSQAHPQTGFAMVVTLIMLLVLVGMAVSLSYVAAIQANLVSAVTGKYISLDAGETCFDHAIEWLTAGAAQTWTNGTGQALDLAQPGNPLSSMTILGDTVPLGQTDNRSALFKSRTGQAQYHSCVVEKAASSTTRGEGYEIGTSNGYGVSSFTYTIRMTAIGDFGVQVAGGVVNPATWRTHSGRSTLEAVIDYTP